MKHLPSKFSTRGHAQLLGEMGRHREQQQVHHTLHHHTTTLAAILKETLSREQGSGSPRVSCRSRFNCLQPKDENLYSYYSKKDRSGKDAQHSFTLGVLLKSKNKPATLQKGIEQSYYSIVIFTFYALIYHFPNWIWIPLRIIVSDTHSNGSTLHKK